MTPGQRIANRFQIERQAGAGGMGALYRAVDLETGAPVAVKILHRGEEDDLSRFAREARILDQVKDAAVVRYIAHGVAGAAQPYLVMEWLDGEDLSARLARAELTLAESFTLLRRVAGALAAVHALGVVHRDIKPSNIFLCDGRVERARLIDFGIARPGNASAVITRKSAAVGTLGYMAPEQARGSAHVDARSDVFSLGCVLFECLTGQPAYAGDNLMAVMAKLLLASPPRLRDERPELPEEVDALVERMLSRDPARRPASGAALLAEIEAMSPLHPEQAALLAPESRARPALTEGEQRFVSVLLAGAGGAMHAGGAAGADGAAGPGGAAGTVPGALAAVPAPGAPAAAADAETREHAGFRSPVVDPSTMTLVAEMPIVAAPDPEEVALRALVADHGGELDRLADRTWVATFLGTARGASLRAHEGQRLSSTGGTATDHAGRAARCALAIRELLPGAPIAVATGRGRVRGRSPAGEAIDRAARLIEDARRDRAAGAAGAQGSPAAQGSPSAQGSPNAQAAQASPSAQAAQRAPIHVDALTAALLEGRFEIDVVSTTPRLLAELAQPEAARSLLGKRTPCVGRDRELRALEDLFEECIEQPTARAALVTAGAGVGKSRLRKELEDRIARATHHGAPVEIWIGRGEPMRAGAPFGLLGQIVRKVARIQDGEPIEARWRKLADRVARRVAEADRGRVAEFLGAMVGVRSSGEESVQLRAARRDPVLMGDQLRRAFVDFLEAECRAQPVVLLLEDLHWGDHPSLEYVDAALRLLSDRPLLVVGFARPEVDELFPRLWADAGATAMRLGALPPRACERLVREALGAAADEATVARLVARAAGNAFFLEELVRAVAEGRGDDLPDTVLAMVESRLEALAPEERRVLRAASVLGQVFWRGAALALLGGEGRAPALDAQLSGLAAREWIARRPESSLKDEIEYTFRHALVREAAYGMLTAEDRALGHRLSVAWLESTGQDDAAVLAEHCERGGELGRAAGYYVRAAEQALSGNDLGGVLRAADRALGCGAAGELAGKASLLRAEAHRFRGELDDAERSATEARGLLPEGSAGWFAALRVAITAALKRNRSERVPALLADLLAGWSDGAPAPEQVAALAWAAAILFLTGRYAEAGSLMARVEPVADRFAADPQIAGTIAWSRAAAALFVGGDLNRHRARLEEAIVCFDRAGDLRGGCGQRANAGFACNELGAYAEAAALLRVSLAGAERMGLRNIAASARQNLGVALARLGELAEARVVEAEAVASFAAMREPRMEGASRAYLAGILLAAGDGAGAEAEARRAVEMLEVAKPLLPHALATLADVLLAGGRSGEALVEARRAAEILGELGQLEEGEMLVRVVHAEALWATGDQEGARRALAEAEARLEERAGTIADPAWRASFLERVPEHARTAALRRAWGRG
ncbi:serine/threonine-protein kinase [Sorangium sp. So ce131]|uniref:serine/threonine-protein kinase n=1 Tax=Sorangium sp. So ce131 TaxID=3133282 RepID=UPI003F5F13E9